MSSTMTNNQSPIFNAEAANFISSKLTDFEKYVAVVTLIRNPECPVGDAASALQRLLEPAQKSATPTTVVTPTTSAKNEAIKNIPEADVAQFRAECDRLYATSKKSLCCRIIASGNRTGKYCVSSAINPKTESNGRYKREIDHDKIYDSICSAHHKSVMKALAQKTVSTTN